MDSRTITRWAGRGVLVKYAGPRGDVQFDAEAVKKLRKDPADRQPRSARTQDDPPPAYRAGRW